MKKRTGKGARRLFAALLAAALAIAALVGCAGKDGQNTSSSGTATGENASAETSAADGESAYGYDVLTIAQHLSAGGWLVKYYLEGDEMLEALDDEMDQYIDYPPDEPLAGYLFANNAETGALDCEVFFFRSPKDAAVLYDFLKDGEQFTPGVSEIRRRGELVYMGYVEVLDLIEQGL